MSDPYQRAEDIGIAHFIDRLVDQRNRAVRALDTAHERFESEALMCDPCFDLLEENWAQEVVYDGWKPWQDINDEESPLDG